MLSVFVDIFAAFVPIMFNRTSTSVLRVQLLAWNDADVSMGEEYSREQSNSSTSIGAVRGQHDHIFSLLLLAVEH